MKKWTSILLCMALSLLLFGCSAEEPCQIAATTAPVWEFTSRLCQGTPLTVGRLVTENVSCLHDYSLSVRQMKLVEQAELVVISGAGLESFMDDLLHDKQIIDTSTGIALLDGESTHDHEQDHDHGQEDSHADDHGHSHAQDPHIWLSPVNASAMAQTICDGLSTQYPQYAARFQENLTLLQQELDTLQTYGTFALTELSCRELITFHDGFGYLAQAFDLEILEAIEEESGSEASAQELMELIDEVRLHELPAVFTEINGSPSAAGVICAETGIQSAPLDMAMGDSGYFSAMYYNIDTLKEALQ